MTHIAVVGDVHGHLQLALCLLARWQGELGLRFDAVLLCGDVGSFTEDAQLDSTTRRHARTNPCELEFLRQWASLPPAPWLGSIFAPIEAGGLGLVCPVVMVHGNHEGFAHLRSLASAAPEGACQTRDLTGAQLHGADLSHADLHTTKGLTPAQLSLASSLDQAKLPGST